MAKLSSTDIYGDLYVDGVISGVLTGNASTATKLQTARKINGMVFDGTQDITTNWWGTARNFYINDYSSTNKGPAVSVNGAGDANLKLPETIKATIKSDLTAGTWVEAVKGSSMINSLKSAGDFHPMLSAKTTNGGMTLAFYNNSLQTGYITKANCDSNTNALSSNVVLADESGNGNWPGNITANSVTATTLVVAPMNTYYIGYTIGNHRITTENVHTGYLKITLPVSWNNTMIRLAVDIYNYTDGTSCTYYLAGYNYKVDSKWYNCTAYSVGYNNNSLCNLTVRFGHDGSKCAIYIGESNTSWSYPQIAIRDILIGYNTNVNANTFKTGWGIIFTTSLGTISSTQTNPSTSSNVCGYKIWTGTQAQYNAISTKDSKTIYYITG